MLQLHFKNWLIILIILLISSGMTFSQPAGKARERIQQFKKIKLLEILSLDESTSEKFLAKYSAWEKKIEEKSKVLDNSIEELEEAVRKGGSKDDIVARTQKLLQQQEEMQAMIAEFLKSMKPLLNETEYAKFLLFESKFKKELQKIMLERLRNKDKDRMPDF